MNKISTFLIGLFISITTTFAAPLPSITFTTSQAVGSSISFMLTPSVANTSVSIDFGSGSAQSKNLQYTSPNTITDVVGTSQTITISGAGIKELDCRALSITDLNVSAYPDLISLNCSSNKLVTLDLTANTALKYLICGQNLITTTIDVSKNTALERFSCDYNKLTSLDVSKNTALTQLSCIWMGLPALDVSKNTALTSLDCRLNALTSLDITHNPELDFLVCLNNKITTLNLSKNTKITTLNCSQNLLTVIDLTKLTKLDDLDIQSNQITSVDLSQCPLLKTIFCQNNSITAIDCSHNPLLQTIYCNSNMIQTADVSKCTAATWIEFSSNQLTALDVTKNTLLKTFAFDNNPIGSIDLSKNTKLESLSANHAQLSTIDLSTNTALTSLYLNWNGLSTIDLSKNTSLSSVNLANNNFKFSTLPLKKTGWSYTYSPQNKINIAKNFKADSELDLSSELSIDGNTTTYSFVTSKNYTLIEGTDYTETNGKFKFLTAQTDSVYGKLVNASFPNFTAGLSTVYTFVGNNIATSLNNTALSENDLSIYASRDQLYIKSALPAQVTVHNVSGQAVNSWLINNDEIKTISVPGVYVVKAANKEKTFIQKVIIE